MSENEVGTYYLYYSVVDACNNAAPQVTRTINVVDRTPPVITLIGDSEIIMEKGDPYDDQGATATDASGDDLTNSIVE